jgi:two-component system phosphate regulon sensor histidine kinase PhoR
MLPRLFTFVLILSLGTWAGACGWSPSWDWQGATTGAVLSASTWVLVDVWQGQRLLRWVLREELETLPTRWGWWGELSDRMRRLQRRLRQEVNRYDERLMRLTAAIQASPNGVLLLDGGNHIEWCNQTAAQHLGLDAQRDRLQLITNLVRDPVFMSFMQQSSGEEGVVIEGRLNRPSAKQRVSLHWFPYGDGHRLLLSRDITELEQADTMRRDFVANVSHEIRTPLTVLSGFIETLQTLPLGEDERGRYLELMAQQSHRMQTLVADLLTLSRLEGSRVPGMTERTPVASLWQSCEHDARGLAGGGHEGMTLTHTLVFSLDSALQGESLAGSRAELQSAMSNLISNALRYTPPGGRVEVGWRLHPPQGVEFWVEDNGPGIAPEHLPRLTERFYRVDRSRSRETGGTGLGLAIVKHVVQRHGGHMHITSVPGQGSRFAFFLPLERFVGSVPLNAGLTGALGPAQQERHQD